MTRRTFMRRIFYSLMVLTGIFTGVNLTMRVDGAPWILPALAFVLGVYFSLQARR